MDTVVSLKNNNKSLKTTGKMKKKILGNQGKFGEFSRSGKVETMFTYFDRVVFARPGGELAHGGAADCGSGMDVLHLDGDVHLPDLLGRLWIHRTRETKSKRFVIMSNDCSGGSRISKMTVRDRQSQKQGLQPVIWLFFC